MSNLVALFPVARLAGSLSKNPVNADAKEIANALQYIKDLISLEYVAAARPMS